MLMAYIYISLVVICCGYAAIRGGGDGRWAAAIMLSGIILSVAAAHVDHSYSHTVTWIFGIDAAVLAALFVLSIRSRRYWPVWMTAFHGVSVATHIATLVDPTFLPKAYQAMVSVWVLPMLLVMLLGIMTDRRAGLIGSGCDCRRSLSGQRQAGRSL
jgi:hypothetical protein